MMRPGMTVHTRGAAAIASLLAVGAGVLLAQTQANWLFGGQGIRNTRHQAAETQISPANAHRLAVKWTFTTTGGVTATPTVSDNTVYFPDWAGFLYAVRADTGELVWRRSISEYTGRLDSV